jgi:hypothetical protein
MYVLDLDHVGPELVGAAVGTTASTALATFAAAQWLSRRRDTPAALPWLLAISLAGLTLLEAATRAPPTVAEWDQWMIGTDLLLGAPNAAIPVAPPPGVRGAYHIRLDLADATIARDTVLFIPMGTRTLEVRTHGNQVWLEIRGLAGGAYFQRPISPSTLVIYDVGSHWLMGWNRKDRFGTTRGRWLLAGRGAPEELVPALWVLPRPLGAPPVLAWMILSAFAVSVPLFAASRRARRELDRLERTTETTPVLDAAGLAAELLTTSGERVALTQPILVPAEARYVLIDHEPARPTYRGQARATAMSHRFSATDRETRVAAARTDLRRLEAFAVLVMLLLATPGVVALARGLTLSLGLA